MSHSITLTRTAQVPAGSGSTGGYFVSITASAGTPNEVFRMVQRPLNPITMEETADFNGVCTYADLQNLPVDAPNPGSSLFRVATFDHVYFNQNDGDNDWLAIQTEVQSLMNELSAAAILNAPQVVNITG
jgi:hypothetical protein